MLCTECKKEQEKRIPNEEKENAQPAEKVCSDVHTTLKSKRSAALILLTGATLMLIMVFIFFLACHVAKSATRQQRPCE